jgi:hypothetical protein
MARKCKTTTDTPYGPRTCFQVSVNRGKGRKPLVAQFGGIPLVQQKRAVLTDRDPTPDIRRKELITRLLRGTCEICKRTQDVQVHHVRTLAELDQPGQPQPPWAQLMANRRRKTLVVCGTCHATIHATPATPLTQ